MALARTNPKTGRYEIWTPSGGAKSFSALDAAHAMAGGPPLGVKLLELKFGCAPPSTTRDIAIELGFEISSLMRAPRNTTVAGISIMLAVVAEVLAPSNCAKCDARGWIAKGSRWEKCEPCEGTGRAPWSNTRRADECGIPRWELRSTWGEIYQEARRALIEAEAAALWHMACRL